MSTAPSHLHLWANELGTLHDHVWVLLSRGVADRRTAARHPTLATVTPQGMPKARTVVLRSADKPGAALDIHTDIHSHKVGELLANPLASLHIWDGSAHLQIRLETEAKVLTGADVEAVWARVPDVARLSYGCDPAPGQKIPGALAYTKLPDQSSFAVLRFKILAMDIVHLGPDHRRARFERDNNWAGQWLAP